VSGTRVTIVGGGVASAAAIAALRADGFDGGITLVSTEETVPYERPPLSKEYLLGDAADVAVVHDETWYASHDVDLLLGTRATGLDLAARRVFLDDGGAVPSATTPCCWPPGSGRAGSQASNATASAISGRPPTPPICVTGSGPPSTSPCSAGDLSAVRWRPRRSGGESASHSWKRCLSCCSGHSVPASAASSPAFTATPG
jgi:hypothetical protein